MRQWRPTDIIFGVSFPLFVFVETFEGVLHVLVEVFRADQATPPEACVVAFGGVRNPEPWLPVDGRLVGQVVAHRVAVVDESADVV